MKIYEILAGWQRRTPTGIERPCRYAATRAEARSEAKAMASSAARNPNLAPLPVFVAQVFPCEVSDRLGKGRSFVVALLNGAGVLEPEPAPLGEIRVRAAVLRCSGCGKSSTAQALTPARIGALCSPCYDDRVLFDDEEREASEALISAADAEDRRASGFAPYIQTNGTVHIQGTPVPEGAK